MIGNQLFYAAVIIHMHFEDSDYFRIGLIVYAQFFRTVLKLLANTNWVNATTL